METLLKKKNHLKIPYQSILSTFLQIQNRISLKLKCIFLSPESHFTWEKSIFQVTLSFRVLDT